MALSNIFVFLAVSMSLVRCPCPSSGLEPAPNDGGLLSETGVFADSGGGEETAKKRQKDEEEGWVTAAEGQFRAMEITAEGVIFHPKWNDYIRDGYGAALLKLPYAVSVPIPVLAAPSLQLYISSQIQIFRRARNLEMARLHVVTKSFCSTACILQDGTYCALSKSAESMVGGPAILREAAATDESRNWERQGNELVIGVVTRSTASCDYHDATPYLLITGLREWIMEEISKGDTSPQTYVTILELIGGVLRAMQMM